MTQPDAATDTPGGATFEALEALQTQAPQNRRLRPPDLLPTKPEKLNKRESKAGLRGLFSRNRASKDADSPQSPRDATRGGGVRTSWVDLGGWSLPHQRPEGALPPISDSGSIAETTGVSHGRPKKAHSAGKKASPVAKGKGGTASWDPPPLFQAYPQALRHAHLPACTWSADAILRMNDKRNGREDPNSEALHDEGVGKSAEKKKKHHRRNSLSHLDWTTKVFVLVTSGYLLQYTGEGSFDRLPEKILHLGRESAAFASDALPGRHWVLRVAETMEPSNSPVEQRSLFSRIPFRAAERRHASNFLMVFEGAEDMDGWISVLRKEIEALGGKKNLSETGKPKADDDELQLKAQVSQRTLVVRDPDRFSRSINPQDLAWQQRHSMSQETLEVRNPVATAESDAPPEHPPDDISTTNSIVSHDGRQLENLRDSAGANRLSYISSGQRTIITSAGSSPACSPTRDSFASNIEELSLNQPPPAPEARPRPNAAAIADRRQSMQTLGPFVDPKLASAHRPHSTFVSPPPMDDGMAFVPTTPNFSVPHAVSRRYSLAKPPPSEGAGPSSLPTLIEPEQSVPMAPPPRSSRRCPPAGLGMSRPLSIVADQPSPIPEVEPSSHPASSHSEYPPSSDDTVTLSVSPPPMDARNNHRGYSRQENSTPSDPFGNRPGSGYNPRKATSMHALRDSSEIAEEHTAGVSSSIKGATRVVFSAPRGPDPARRPMSSMGHYERSRSQSPSTKQMKRASLQPTISTPPSDRRSPRFSLPGGSDMSSARASTLALLESKDPSQRALSPPPTLSPQNPASGELLAAEDPSKALFNRRSIPHLPGNPPPAPPPTCALPPIPQKIRVKN